MQICQGRMVGGRLSTAKRNKILNNLLIDNGQPFAISDSDNVCDGNVVAGSRKPFDLDAWQQSKSWDRHRVVAEIRAEFEPGTLECRWTTDAELLRVPRLDTVPTDLFSRPREGDDALPGPFATRRPVCRLPEGGL
jgi:hypothetical protein